MASGARRRSTAASSLRAGPARRPNWMVMFSGAGSTCPIAPGRPSCPLPSLSPPPDRRRAGPAGRRELGASGREPCSGPGHARRVAPPDRGRRWYRPDPAREPSLRPAGAIVIEPTDRVCGWGTPGPPPGEGLGVAGTQHCTTAAGSGTSGWARSCSPTAERPTCSPSGGPGRARTGFQSRLGCPGPISAPGRAPVPTPQLSEGCRGPTLRRHPVPT